MAAQAIPEQVVTLEDYLFTMETGMDSGTSPILLKPNAYAYGTNTTNRGDFLSNRPAFKNRQLTFDSPVTLATFQSGLFQGGCYASPDATAPKSGEVLVFSIAGRLLVATPNGNVVNIVDVTPVAGGNPATQTQAWLFQAEMFVIVNDGLSAPLFLNLNTMTTTRSTNNGTVNAFNTTVATKFTTPAAGTSISITLTSGANINLNDILIVQNAGRFLVSAIAGAVITGTFSADVATGSVVDVGALVNWAHKGTTQLPPGRMGAYVMQRIWLSLTDGKQFIASDISGGPSGTAANNYRDAILNITENSFLAGGGNFSVPGNTGNITAILGLPTLDASLGQGPVFVVTPKAAYSCQAPLDRTTWTSLTNPILTATMLTNAGVGQPSTVTANSDVIMRAPEGVRSLIVTRNDFQSWGNTIMSFELLRVMPKDNRTLLPWATATVFDNRLLFSMSPQVGKNGIYHKGVASLNFDPLSSLAGKQPACWEGVWLGLYPMQFMTGYFGQVERCWAITFNPTSQKTELHEVLNDGDSIVDDDSTPIGLNFESAVLFKDQDPRQRHYKRLNNGEIYVDDLQGTVNFYVYYRPDFYPTWVPWFTWTECQKQPTGTPGTADYQPGFRPRMGLGEPSPRAFDPCSGIPLRQGFTFQMKIEIVGHCIFRGARFECVEIPKPKFAPLGTTPICAT